MPRRFYSAWALAIILALVLPIAIPFWIWPTNDPPDDRYQLAASDWTAVTVRDQYYATRIVPNEVDVSPCSFGPGVHDRGYAATVTYRGVYGLPLGTTGYDCSGRPELGVGHPTPPFVWNQNSTFLMVVLLIGGAVFVSIPFWRIQERRRAGIDRSYWFRDEPIVPSL